MSIETILTPILANICQIGKWQRDFLIEYFKTLFSRQGRANFENLSRYSKHDEITLSLIGIPEYPWGNPNTLKEMTISALIKGLS